MTQTSAIQRNLWDAVAPVMFSLSLMFLVILGALIVVWVDIPRFSAVSETVEGITGVQSNRDSIAETATQLGHRLVMLAWILGFVIVSESIVQHVAHIRRFKPERRIKLRFQLLALCICPPLRLASPNLNRDGAIWLPGIGWQQPGRKLFRRLQSVFSKPMLFFALLILPVLLIEFGLHGYVEQHLWLRLAMHVCTGLIWCAFAIEFIVLLSAADRKFTYVRQNWIDLAIILLPIIMFLRSLRALRLMKFAKIAKAQQLTNLSRVYRVRGVAMKAFRALMLLEVFGRIIPTDPEKKLARLQQEFDEKQEDLDELRAEMELLRQKIQMQEQNQQEQNQQETVSSARASVVRESVSASPKCRSME